MEIQEQAALYETLLIQSIKMEGAMGAIAFAVLEMFRRGGLSEEEVEALHDKMKHYFMKPSSEECNAILKMVETRLERDKDTSRDTWYS
jgi:hypothetical protein